MQSTARTVPEYLAELPPERRAAVSAVREVILKNLPPGYEEVMDGMIGYVVPLKTFPAGYLGQKDVPLPYAGIASQKNHMAVYLMCLYGHRQTNDWFLSEYKKTGKRMDVGKSCVRFKKLEDLPVELIGQTIAKVSVDDYIAAYLEVKGGR